MNSKQVKLEFWAGNPQVQIINGEIIIYPYSNRNDKYQDFEEDLQYHELKGSKYICCPQIPIHISIIEFCDFISPPGSQFTQNIKNLRVLKGPYQNSYIIVIKMASKKSAIDFIYNYQNKKFNFIEPDECQFAILQDAYIEQGQLQDSKYNSSKIFIEAQECLFQDDLDQVNCPICLEIIFQENQSEEFKIGQQLIKQQKNQIDKQNEFIDDFNITILCSHTLNWKCLVRQGKKNYSPESIIENERAQQEFLNSEQINQTCPLCRYYQNPQQVCHCDDCDITDNFFEQVRIQKNNQLYQQIEMQDQFEQYTLWTCLLCGHIGCFNMISKLEMNQNNLDNNDQPILINIQKGHAFDHYKKTMHVYSMEIETKKVWDFSKENYVNRLIQNQIDGKLIEIQSLESGEYQYENSDNLNIQEDLNKPKEVHLDSVFRFNKKLDSINHEYNTILVKTLDDQRQYYENEIWKIQQEQQNSILQRKQKIIDLKNFIKDIDSQKINMIEEIEELKQQEINLKENFKSGLTETMEMKKKQKIIINENEQIEIQMNKILEKQNEEQNDLENQIINEKVMQNDLINNLKMQKKIGKQGIAQGGQTFMINDGGNLQKKVKNKKHNK